MQLAHPIINPNVDSAVQGDLVNSVNSVVISAVHADMFDVVDTAAAVASRNDSRRMQYAWKFHNYSHLSKIVVKRL